MNITRTDFNYGVARTPALAGMVFSPGALRREAKRVRSQFPAQGAAWAEEIEGLAKWAENAQEGDYLHPNSVREEAIWVATSRKITHVSVPVRANGSYI